MKTALLASFTLPSAAYKFTVQAPAKVGAPRVCAPCYEKPPACTGQETAVQITGVTGSFCSPKCVANQCPKGNGTFTATPSCVLETQGSSKPTQCALICTPGSNAACPEGATCQSIQGEGICTYPTSAQSEFATIAAEINAMDDATWVADPTASARFGSMQDVKDLCGTWNKNHPVFTSNAIDAPVYVKLPVDEETEAQAQKLLASGAIPAAFDARTAHSNCTVIATIRDQSACGSCWAFGSTEAFEDRRCIATGEDTMFSTEDTAGCCKGFACGMSNGCGGGQPSAALQWMANDGVVTGDGFFDDKKGTSCKPYTLAPCAHHVPPTSKYPACPTKEYSLQCTRECESEYTKDSYEADKTKGVKAMSYRSVSAMQTAIMNDGPLAVAFTVYSDFPTYKSGVYTHKSGSALGGHAVEMIGWGEENGTPYWTIKNSWNEQWGDGGTFKIARGTNECGIEDDVSGISF